MKVWLLFGVVLFFFSSRRRHTRYWRDWSSDVCSSDLQIKISRPFFRLPMAQLLHLDSGWIGWKPNLYLTRTTILAFFVGFIYLSQFGPPVCIVTKNAVGQCRLVNTTIHSLHYLVIQTYGYQWNWEIQYMTGMCYVLLYITCNLRSL